MTLIEEFRDYWNLRSSGFSGSVNYDMDNRSEEALAKMERETRNVPDWIHEAIAGLAEERSHA